MFVDGDLNIAIRADPRFTGSSLPGIIAAMLGPSGRTTLHD